MGYGFMPGTGRLADVPFYPSPHYNERPYGVVIDLLVIHGISLPPGQFGGDAVHRLFMGTLVETQDPALLPYAHFEVASHFFIQRTGALSQYVDCNHRAWHAGQSSFRGRENCNDYALGIELEGTDTEPYTDAQYQTLNALLPVLQGAYPNISFERIVGHSVIAPDRKTDPGPAFEWLRLMNCD